MGVTLGAPALAFIPVLGALVLLTGVVAGAAAGQAVESHARALNYPESISVPMSCANSITGTRGPTIPAAAPLGMQVRSLSKSEALSAGLVDRSGVLVTGVLENGRAAGAGLRSGDIILTAGEHELSDPAMLEDRIRASAGAALTLKIWRDGQPRTLMLNSTPAVP